MGAKSRGIQKWNANRLIVERKEKENRSTKATKSEHKVVSREEWLAARKKLLEAEKELTRRSDEAIVTVSGLKSRNSEGNAGGVKIFTFDIR